MMLANWIRPLLNAPARHAVAALSISAAGLLTGCGGPTRAVENFQPTRVVVLGDELSQVESDGRKYSINALESDGLTVSCAASPTWSQVVASVFKLSVCPAGAQNTASLMQARSGADVAALQVQVDAVAAATGFGAKDLVTVLIGYNDVLSLHSQRAGLSAPVLDSRADTAGRQAASQICRVLQADAKVVVSTMPDLGLSPLGLAQADGGALLTRLSDRFNAAMRVALSECRVAGVPVDGWQFGLILGDEKLRSAGTLTTLSNKVSAACSAAAPNCTTGTLTSGASSSGWLWATDTLPGPVWHSLTGSAVTSLAFHPI